MRICAAALMFILLSGAQASAESALCDDPAGVCSAKVTPACLARVGAGTLSTAALDGACGAQLRDYRDCIAEAATQCGGATASGRDQGRCDETTAEKLWTLAEADNDCLSYQAFLDACPAALRAGFARARRQRLGCGRGAAATALPGWTPSSSELRAAQTELARLGLYSGSVDGLWGGGSAAAMKRFQTAQGLTPATGALTKNGLAALRAAPTPARRRAVGGGDLRAEFREAAGDTVFFEFDSSELTPEAAAALNYQAKWLSAHPDLRARIEGHDDRRGRRDSSLAMGQRRAQAVLLGLVERGVARGRLSTISYGSERPRAECENESCWAQNRRVEIVLE